MNEDEFWTNNNQIEINIINPQVPESIKMQVEEI